MSDLERNINDVNINFSYLEKEEDNILEIEGLDEIIRNVNRESTQNDLEFDKNEAMIFLKWYFSDLEENEFIEIRAFKDGKQMLKVDHRFHQTPESIIQTIEKLWNKIKESLICISVNPRTAKIFKNEEEMIKWFEHQIIKDEKKFNNYINNTFINQDNDKIWICRGDSEFIKKCKNIFLDFDYKFKTKPKFDKFRTKIVQVLKEIGIEDDCCTFVDSGGGYHIHIKLSEAIDKEKWGALITSIFNYLSAKGFPLDQQCKDFVRLARLPGTWNNRYEIPLKVRVLKIADKKLDVERVDEIIKKCGMSNFVKKPDIKVSKVEKSEKNEIIKKLKQTQLRPCIRKVLEMLFDGNLTEEQFTHNIRADIVLELRNAGWRVNDIYKIFEFAEDYDEKKTKYYVDDLYFKRENYTPYSCAKLRPDLRKSIPNLERELCIRCRLKTIEAPKYLRDAVCDFIKNVHNDEKITSFLSFLDEAIKDTKKKIEFLNRPLVIIARYFKEEIANEILEYKYDKDGNIKDVKILHGSFADLILNFHKIKYCPELDEFLLYNPIRKRYSRVSKDHEIRQIIRSLTKEIIIEDINLENKLTKNKQDEIINAIKERSETNIKIEDINNIKKYIPVKGRLLRLPSSRKELIEWFKEGKESVEVVDVDPEKHIFTFNLNIDFKNLNEIFKEEELNSIYNTIEKELKKIENIIDSNKYEEKVVHIYYDSLSRYFTQKIQNGDFDNFHERYVLQFFKELELTDEKLRLLFKFIAYIFIGGQTEKKGLIIVGPRHAGKTTFIKYILGELEDPYKDKSEKTRIVLNVNFNVLANPQNVKERVGIFYPLVIHDAEVNWKKEYVRDFLLRLVGGDEIDYAIKYDKSGIKSAPVNGKVIVTGNKLPEIELDESQIEAWYSRWVIIHFKKSFSVNSSFIDGLKKDYEGRSILFSAILTIFRPLVLLEGIKEQDEEYVRNEWEIFVNPLRAFCKQEIIEDENAETLIQLIRERFLNWLLEKNLPIDVYQNYNNKKTFTSELKIILQREFNIDTKDLNQKYKRHRFDKNVILGEVFGVKPYKIVGFRVKGVPTISEINEVKDILLDVCCYINNVIDDENVIKRNIQKLSENKKMLVKWILERYHDKIENEIQKEKLKRIFEFLE